MNDFDTQQTFLSANELLAPALARRGIRRLELNFAAATPAGVTHAAVELNGQDIAINAAKLGGISFEIAIGICGHEHGHVRYRTTPDGRFINVDRLPRSIAEEEFCEWTAGELMIDSNVPLEPYISYLRKTKRDPQFYPDTETAIARVRQGAQHARSQAVLRTPQPKQWAKIAAVIGVVLFIGALLSD